MPKGMLKQTRWLCPLSLKRETLAMSDSTMQLSVPTISTSKINVSSISWEISSSPAPQEVRQSAATTMVTLVLCPTYSKAVMNSLKANPWVKTIASFWSVQEELETKDWGTSRVRTPKVALSVGEATKPSTKLQDMARLPAVISDNRTETMFMSCSELCEFDSYYKIKCYCTKTTFLIHFIPFLSIFCFLCRWKVFKKYCMKLILSVGLI